MAITPRALNTNLNDALFLFFSDPLLEGNIPFVYRDAPGDTGIPTIGVGYALLTGTPGKHDWALVDYEAKLKQAVPTLTTTQLTTLKDKLTQAMNVLNGKGGSNPFPTGTGTNILDWSMTDIQVRTLFDNTVSTYPDIVKTWLGGAKWAGDSVTIYDRLQGSQEMFALTSLAYNNMIGFGKNNKLKSPSLRRAIFNGDRAEAWYEIRYNSNGGDSEGRGIAKRRYFESEMFGLYNDPTAPTLDEAKDAYRMLTLHRDKIMKYESLYGLLPDGTRGTSHPATGDTRTGLELAQALGTSVLLLPTQQISTIVESFNSAKMAIMADLGANSNSDVTNAYQAWVVMQGHNPASFNSTDIYLDPNKQTIGIISANIDPITGVENLRDSIIIGESTTGKYDYLIGSKGSDLMVGGNGNDYLYGGAGDDVLAGGDGDDTYIINNGDGHDTIEDKLGVNHIIIDGVVLGDFFTSDGGATYISYDGDFSAEKANGDLIVRNTSDGQQRLTLNQNFQSGDFGITLSDAPQTILPFHTVIGDPVINTATGIAPGSEPTNWHVTNTYNQQYDANNQLVSYDVDYFLVDANGNPTQPGGPVRTDKLYGTAANDYLIGLGGGDVIFAYGPGGADGGNDILDGGTGRDWLAAGSGNDILIGGADTDVLEGGLNNDRLYGDSEINTADAIAQGNTHTGTGLIGDWLSGESGDDTLVGGDGNDVLAGGGGRDLIIAGAGDDEIMGDAQYRPDTMLADWFLNGNPSSIWTVSGEYPRIIDPQPVGIDEPTDSDADVIYAGVGNDHVWAGAGNDVVYGEAGNDVLNGNGGSDMIFGGAGDDQIHGDGAVIAGGTVVEGNDYLDGGGGADTIWGNGGSDILVGGAGDDVLYGDNEDGTGEGNDFLDGGDGNDTLFGGAGNDVIDGGAGNDVIDGGVGNDTYLFGIGSGQDTIVNFAPNSAADKVDVVQFTNVLSTQVTARRTSVNALTLSINGTTDTLTIADYFTYDGNSPVTRLEEIRFADTVWTVDQIKDMTSQPTSGNDELYGYSTNDVISGGDGNDIISGLAGDDVLNGDAGNDVLSGGTGNDTLNGGSGHDYLYGDLDNDVLNGGSGIDDLYGGTGDDTLSGGAGLDYLYGGSGNDVYLFGRNSGADYIQESDWNFDGVIETGNYDVVQFAADVLPSDVLVQREYDDLVLRISGTTDVLRVTHYFTSGTYPGNLVEEFRFSGGTVWTAADLMATPITYTPATTVSGSGIDDTIVLDWYGAGFNSAIGYGGNDYLYGGANNDLLDGGDGNDYFVGGTGNDLILGGAGDDLIWGDHSVDFVTGNNDILDGGTGNDNLYGGGGSDCYVFGRGYGQDFIFESIDGGNLDAVQFIEGVLPSDITLRREYNNLLLSINGTNDVLTIGSYFYDASNIPWATPPIEEIRFDDGTVWTPDQVKSLVPAMVFQGTDAGEILEGTGWSDVLYGLAGDDYLYGWEGNDTLDGGAGNDQLWGMAGSDTYLFSLGGGHDNIHEWGGWRVTRMCFSLVRECRLWI